jgi:uncharacterized lipoprotein YddW (UPF0748 family)
MKSLLKFFVPFFLIIFIHQAYSQNNDIPPKREFRAAWVATAIQLDWPKTTNPELGELSLRNIIRQSKDMGMNAVVFQVVARGDAMYRSERLPWAPWLTGSPGNDPGWDPLAVAIDEARKLGMELHAWFNVSLVASDHTGKSANSDPPHIVYAEPEWVVRETTNHWLNPGIPDARQWQVENVIELVENYDIDAIHFDYIRYPSGGMPGITDYNTRERYDPAGIANLNDWRRNNITEFVRAVHAEVRSRKLWVKIGGAVMGHYKQFPGSWAALWGFDSAYQESRLWLQEGLFDYAAPMIYWDIGNSIDRPPFEFLVRDWAGEHYDRHIYVGTAAYKSNVIGELPDQIDTVRAARLHGQVHFRYDNINQSPPPFGDRYDYLSLVPTMEWMQGEAPPPPVALRYEIDRSDGTAEFRWEDSSENDETFRYVVYQFTHNTVTEEDLNDPRNILYFTGENYFRSTAPGREGNYFAVTALDRNNHESTISELFELFPPPAPALAYPIDQAVDQRDTVSLAWEFPENAGRFDIQVAADPSFSGGLFLHRTGVSDTTLVLTGMKGQQEYYWRVRAYNPAGVSDFSEPYSFTTGFPVEPLLVSPAAGVTNMPLEITFYWHETDAADSYRFHLAYSNQFQTDAIIVDTIGVLDTTITVSGLEGNRIHFWRVSALNEYGASLWSGARGFRTGTPTYVADRSGIPAEYALSQNYPNPFNPVTTILYALPEQSYVDLRVFDLLGRVVAVFVDEIKPAGVHSVDFNADNLPSGVYIFRIITSEYTASKRMMLVK